MKMTLEKLEQAYMALIAFASAEKERGFSLPTPVRFKLADNLQVLQGVYKLYVEERNNLIRRLGEAKEGGQDYEVAADSPNFPEFKKESKALAETEKDVALEVILRSEIAGSDKNPNRIPIDTLMLLQDVGIVVKHRPETKAEESE